LLYSSLSIDQIRCFHATDCESGYGEFKNLPKEQRTKLKAALIQIIHEHEDLGGFGAAIIIEDFVKVRDSSNRARQVLGPDPYFLCFQVLLISICEEFEDHDAGPGMKVACIFEDQKEFSGRSKGLLGKFRVINPRYSARLGTVTYAGKTEFVPLEIADNLAYEGNERDFEQKIRSGAFPKNCNGENAPTNSQNQITHRRCARKSSHQGTHRWGRSNLKRTASSKATLG
jgi:hypothetical protein